MPQAADVGEKWLRKKWERLTVKVADFVVTSTESGPAYLKHSVLLFVRTHSVSILWVNQTTRQTNHNHLEIVTYFATVVVAGPVAAGTFAAAAAVAAAAAAGGGGGGAAAAGGADDDADAAVAAVEAAAAEAVDGYGHFVVVGDGFAVDTGFVVVETVATVLDVSFSADRSPFISRSGYNESD